MTTLNVTAFGQFMNAIGSKALGGVRGTSADFLTQEIDTTNGFELAELGIIRQELEGNDDALAFVDYLEANYAQISGDDVILSGNEMFRAIGEAFGVSEPITFGSGNGTLPTEVIDLTDGSLNRYELLALGQSPGIGGVFNHVLDEGWYVLGGFGQEASGNEFFLSLQPDMMVDQIYTDLLGAPPSLRQVADEVGYLRHRRITQQTIFRRLMGGSEFQALSVDEQTNRLWRAAYQSEPNPADPVYETLRSALAGDNFRIELDFPDGRGAGHVHRPLDLDEIVHYVFGNTYLGELQHPQQGLVDQYLSGEPSTRGKRADAFDVTAGGV